MENNTANLDNWLIKRLVEGDYKAFTTLFKRYFTDLCNYSNGIIANEEAAKDIVVDCYLKIWDNHKELEIKNSFRVYIFGFVHKRSLNYLRHRAVQIKYQQEKRMLEMDVDYQNSPLKSIEVSELKEKITSSIASLPEKCQEIFKLSRFEDKTYDEIAQELDISIGTVRTQMSRALEKLRKALRSYIA